MDHDDERDEAFENVPMRAGAAVDVVHNPNPGRSWRPNACCLLISALVSVLLGGRLCQNCKLMTSDNAEDAEERKERRLIKILIWNFTINKKETRSSGKVFLVIWISLDKLKDAKKILIIQFNFSKLIFFAAQIRQKTFPLKRQILVSHLRLVQSHRWAEFGLVRVHPWLCSRDDSSDDSSVSVWLLWTRREQKLLSVSAVDEALRFT